MSHIDIRLLIREVAIRPIIWNIHSGVPRLTNDRINAWYEVCGAMFINFNTSSEARKDRLYRFVSSKWKSLRDSYVREYRKIALGNKRNSRKYIYYKTLSFLKPTVKLRSTVPHIKCESKQDPLDNDDEDADEDDDESMEDEERETSKSMMLLKACSLKKSGKVGNTTALQEPENVDIEIPSQNRLSDAELESIPELLVPEVVDIKMPIIERTLSSHSHFKDDEDEDRLFLLSLVKDLKKIPEMKKLEAKSELMLVLNKWKQSGAY